MTFSLVITFRPKDKEKLRAASDGVADSLKKTQEEVSSTVPTMTCKTLSYDVFISYSHQNKTHANKVLETLKSLEPDLRIFIDTAGLNTGTSWQQILYNALGKIGGVVFDSLFKVMNDALPCFLALDTGLIF